MFVTSINQPEEAEAGLWLHTAHTGDIFNKCWPAVQLFARWVMAEVLMQFCRSSCFTRTWEHWHATVWCSFSLAGINSTGHPQGSLQLPKYIIDCKKIKLNLFLPSKSLVLLWSVCALPTVSLFRIVTLASHVMVRCLCVNPYQQLVHLAGQLLYFPNLIWKLMAKWTMFVRSVMTFALYSLKRLHDHHHWT